MSEDKESEKVMGKKETDPLAIIKEISSLNILKPVSSRIRTRMKEIDKVAKAKTEKIMRGNSVVHITTPPKVFCTPRNATISNGVGTITYQVYKMDKDGNKAKRETKSIMPNSGKEVVIDASYIIEKEVVETIEDKQPIKRRVHMYDDQ